MRWQRRTPKPSRLAVPVSDATAATVRELCLADGIDAPEVVRRAVEHYRRAYPRTL